MPSFFSSRVRTSRPGRRARAVTLAILATACAGCAAPAEAPIDVPSTVRAVDERAAHLVDIPAFQDHPLRIPRPDPSRADHPEHPDFWRIAAWAYSPDIRAARRRVIVARARRDASGLPGAIALSGDQTGFDSADRATEVAATFDVLALLGLGRARAAREIADAEERAAIADLESTVWKTFAEVERRRTAIATLSTAVRELLEIETRADRGARRIALLAERGRVAQGDRARWDSVRTATARMRTMLEIEITDERKMLAEVSGIPASDPAFLAIANASEEPTESDVSAPIDRDALVLNLPVCRARLMDYAVAEAAVRVAAAEAWPDVRLGPKPTFEPGRIVPGGMIEIEIPFPGSADKKIQEALAARDGAREAFEDAVLEAGSRAEAAKTAFRLEERAFDAAAEIRRSVLAESEAAEARFLTDAAMIEGYTMGIERYAEAVLSLARSRTERIRRAIDLREALGPTTNEKKE